MPCNCETNPSSSYQLTVCHEHSSCKQLPRRGAGQGHPGCVRCRKMLMELHDRSTEWAWRLASFLNAYLGSESTPIYLLTSSPGEVNSIGHHRT